MTVATHNIKGTTVKIGTAAERAALAATSVGAGTEFWESDTGNTFKSNGTSWLQDSNGGAGLVTDGALATKITVSGAVTYIGEAVTGTAQATAAWRCQKIDTTTGTVITWADGNGNFDNVATDLTTLTYS